MRTTIDGVNFRLDLTAEGLPYILYRWTPRPYEPSRGHWAIAWAEWHKGLPTGIRMRAIEAMGYRWDRTPPACRWVMTMKPEEMPL